MIAVGFYILGVITAPFVFVFMVIAWLYITQRNYARCDFINLKAWLFDKPYGCYRNGNGTLILRARKRRKKAAERSAQKGGGE